MNTIENPLTPNPSPLGGEGNQMQAAFEAVCRMSSAQRAAWYEEHETVASVRHEVEELLRYDDLAEEEAFFAPKATTTQPDSLLGSQVGPFEVISMIGRGGMGSVYLARRRLPYEQDVALKVADLRLGSGAARFDEERQVLADLHHPGIAKLLDGGVLPDDRPYLVMEYVPGEHIDVFAEKHKLRVMERVQLWLQVCEAVASAHERGIIHRDLKPSNILVTGERNVVVVDFGLARRWEQDSGLTRTATILGTPEYMAPEQASGKKLQTKPATDVYALGAVLYTLLTGRPPFRAESPLQFVTIMLQDDPVPPRRLNPAVPRDLETICLKCLEKEAGKRYATAKELTADVQRLQRGESIQARSIGVAGRGWRWAKRRPLLASLSAMLLITIVCSLIIVANYWRKANNALELARQASGQLFDHAIALKNQPAMQRPQVELLRNTITSYGKLVQALDDAQLYLQYFRARRELGHANQRLGFTQQDIQEAEQLMKEVEACAATHPSHEMSMEWVLCINEFISSMKPPEDRPLQRMLLAKSVDILRGLSRANPQKDSIRGLLAEMLTTLGNLETRMGMHEESQMHREQALEILRQLYQLYKKDDPLSRIRLCDCLDSCWVYGNHQRGRGIQGQHFLEEALQIDQSLQSDYPNHPEYRESTHAASMHLAMVLEWQGEWNRAYQVVSELVEVCERLKKKFPDVVPHQIREAGAQYYLGELAFVLSKHDLARQHYEKSLTCYQNLSSQSGVDSVTLIAHCNILAECPIKELCNTRLAVELANQAQQLNPTSQKAWFNLGRCLFRNGQWVEAEKALKHALTLPNAQDELSWVNIYLALTYAKMGQLEKARTAYTETDKYASKYPKEVVMMRLRNEAQQLLKQK